MSIFSKVSYRIGEKGSVKILYSENDSAFGSSPGISPGLHTSSSTSSGASDDLNAEIAAYLPPPPPQQQQQPPQHSLQQVCTNKIQKNYCVFLILNVKLKL